MQQYNPPILDLVTAETSVWSSTKITTYIATSVTALWENKGPIDCGASPNYPAASNGDAYVVSVAGKVGGASGIVVNIQDLVVATADNAGGTQAAVGTSWSIFESNRDQATESLLGVAALSTQVKTDAGTDDLTMVTPLKLATTIGATIQAYDAGLDSLSGLVYASDSFIKVTATDAYAIRTLVETKTDLSLENVTNVATDDTAYNATSWNTNLDASTKNAIRDKVELLDADIISNATHLGILNTCGFVNRSDSTLSWSARDFTITPAGTSVYWIDGVSYDISAPDSIEIADTSGLHVLYYDGSTLSEAVNPSDATMENIIINKALVGIVYWNTNDNSNAVLADERHGFEMSGQTHHWLHDNIGSKFKSGLVVSGYTLNTKSDAALSVDLTNGKFYDEDIEVEIEDGSAATQYEQVLTGDAEIPVLFRDDVDGAWTEQAASTLPYISATGGANRLARMNDDGDGTWSQVEIGNTKYVTYTLIATNDWQYPIKMVQGTTEYNTAADAMEGASTEMVEWGDLPAAETVILYRFIMQTGAYAGTKKAQIIEIVDFRFSGLTGANATAQAHASLSGLSNDDHVQYILEDGTRAFSGNQDFGTNDITGVGSLGVTGTRLTKGWFTNLEITNAPTVSNKPVVVNPMTAVGDIMYGGASGIETSLAGNSTTATQYFTSTGTGAAAQAQVWSALDIVNDTTPQLGGDLANKGQKYVTEDGFGFFDEAGNEILLVYTDATPVNYLKVTASDTNVDVGISVDGSDANIDLDISAKGTGSVIFSTNFEGTPGNTFSLPGMSFVCSPVVPSQITGNVNNYAPGDGFCFYLDSDGAYNITGLAGGVDGRIVTFVNTSANRLTFLHENVGSDAANRFLNPGSGDPRVDQYQTIQFQYFGADSRWYMFFASHP